MAKDNHWAVDNPQYWRSDKEVPVERVKSKKKRKTEYKKRKVFK